MTTSKAAQGTFHRYSFEVDSEITKQRLLITVTPGDRKSPVLYVVDPIFLYEVAVGAATLLRTGARFTGSTFPSLTIVGVGYPSTDPADVFARRARDLTPSDGHANPPIGLPSLAFGGAERFLAALVDEVIPAVEVQRRPRAERVIAGFSFGGLFGLYCLFHRPEVFSRYLLGSPSLWWDDGIAFAWEEGWAREHDDLPASLFVSAGSNEQLVGNSWKNERLPLEILQRLKQVDHLNELVTRLTSRNYPSLTLASAQFADEYHLTAPAASLTRGLLAMFDDER